MAVVPPEVVPVGTLPAVGALSAISTRLSWSSSVAVATCLCSASETTRLIGSSVPWLEGPIDPSSTKNVTARAIEATRQEQSELVAEHEPACADRDVSRGGKHRIAFVRKTRAHRRTGGRRAGLGRPGDLLRGTAVSGRGGWVSGL